jgi:SpoVK/Ycf46/Vps4 family AAA+-type ATPase
MKTKADAGKRKRNLLRDIEFIAHQAVDSKLSRPFMRNVKESADALSDFLGCNRMQVVLFSIICNINFGKKAVGIDRIAYVLDCNTITVAKHMNELEQLQKKKILRNEADGKNPENLDSISTISWSVNPALFDALRKGKPFAVPKNEIRDSYELITTIGELTGKQNEGEITSREMWQEIARIESTKPGIEFLREIKSLVPDKKERILFVNLCYEYFNGNPDCELIPMIGLVTSDKREQLEMRLRISNGNSMLVSKGLITTREGFFRSETELRLTGKAIEMLTKDDKKLNNGKKAIKNPELLPAKDIIEKPLFFTTDEHEKLGFLTKLLQQDHYKGLTKRLGKCGMKTGIAVLFSGPPGTGKTESVLQIARQTGRDLLQVTISETKSKWFGESERKIKEVFDRYRKLVEESEIAPILFFNEADGIFGSRKQTGDSSVDQTENAIQNIILQEMEELKGILIATTNMKLNFDKAFDRRFLYKIHFERPVPEARFRIWKNRIPSLTDASALHLSKAYDLSGGQIDNVARKYLMNRILNGKLPTHKQVEAWCREENNTQKTNNIGYKL